MRSSLLTTELLDVINGEEYLSKLLVLTLFLLTRLFLIVQQGTFLSFDLVILKRQVGDVIVERHDLSLHAPLIIDDLTVFIFVVSGELVQTLVELLLGGFQYSIAIANLSHFCKLIIALVLDIFQKVLILLHGRLLLLYAGFLSFKNGNLLPLTLNLSFLLLVFLSELGNVLITIAHDFGIEIQEGGILNQTLLELVILLEQLAFFCLELKFLLGKLFLFVDICLLILVHFTTFVEEACRWRYIFQLLCGNECFLFDHLFKILLFQIYYYKFKLN